MSNKTLNLPMRPSQPVPAGSQPPPGLHPSRVPPPLGSSRFAAYRPTPHPQMEAMYWACADLLTLASQLGSEASPPTAHELRRHLGQLFGAMQARARAAGIAQEDITDATYAIMALVDEILVQTNWLGRLDWQASPLQLTHFHENTAGENFFRRAHVLTGQPHRAHVLQIYFLCLALGFQGRYAMGRGAELQSVYDQIAAILAQFTLPSEVISPHGEPPDAGRNLFQREAPIVRIALGLFAVGLVVFVGLRLTLSSQVSSATQRMHEYAGAPPPPPGKP